jgi:CheY-like chemotaxis protein
VKLLKPILLVEDSAKDVELTIAALEEGHLANRVVVVSDGIKALQYLKKQVSDGTCALPTVILLDIKMPKISGIEVLRSIKSDPSLKQLPVVMLTSSREGPDMHACYELGANGYVVKPVEFAEFFEAVKTLGKFWAVVNEPPDRTGSMEESRAVLATPAK